MLRLCGLVMNWPQVGVGCTGSGRNSVAEACMHRVLFMGVMVAAVVNKDLERLRGVDQYHNGNMARKIHT